jgi:anti-sigma regulatory factor (Ser/Thr protein kinase)
VSRRNSFRLPRHPASVGLARRRVREHLADWGHRPDDPALADAVLVVSELATNVVRHGPLLEREFEVAVTALGDGSCLIEVSDAGRGWSASGTNTAAACTWWSTSPPHGASGPGAATARRSGP